MEFMSSGERFLDARGVVNSLLFYLFLQTLLDNVPIRSTQVVEFLFAVPEGEARASICEVLVSKLQHI